MKCFKQSYVDQFTYILYISIRFISLRYISKPEFPIRIYILVHIVDESVLLILFIHAEVYYTISVYAI